MVPRQEKGNLAPNKIIIAHLYCDLNLHVCVTFRFDGCQHVYQNNSNNRTKKNAKVNIIINKTFFYTEYELINVLCITANF